MPRMAWTTYSLSNGTHTIRAAVSDDSGDIAYSPPVTVTVSNDIHNLSVSKALFNVNDPNPSNRTTTISALQDQSCAWQISLTEEGASTPTRVFTGTGTAISVTWDGTDSTGNAAPPGQYTYTISSASGSASGWLEYLNAHAGPITALLVKGSQFNDNSNLLQIVESACRYRNFQVITLPYDDATWENFSYYMMVYQPSILYVRTHGHYEIRDGYDCIPTNLPQVSEFLLNDSVVYAYRPQDSSGNYFEQYPAPGQPAYASIPVNPPNYFWPNKAAHYVSELNFMSYSPLRLVWMDACLDGRIGADVGNLTDQLNPYAVSGANDLASEFGIYNNAWSIGASFCGYYEPEPVPPYPITQDRYADFLGQVFGSIKVGYSLDQAVTRDAWNNPEYTARYPEGIDMNFGPSVYSNNDDVENWCFNWRVPMPPYHNLRVHGNPYDTYLSP